MQVLALLLLALPLTRAIKHKASDYFEICSISDPNRNECVKTTLDRARPKFIAGIPELKMPSIDPLFVSRMEMNQGQNNFKFKFVLKNLTIYGLKDYQIRSVRASKDFKWMNVTMFTPWMNMKGDYEMGGQILLLPVKGDGQAEFNFTDVTTDAYVHLEKYEKSGKTHIRVTDYNWRIEPGDGKSHFTNLFNGDQKLGETMNTFLNQHSKEAYQTYRELPEKAFNELFKELANRVLSNFPLDQWVKP